MDNLKSKKWYFLVGLLVLTVLIAIVYLLHRDDRIIVEQGNEYEYMIELIVQNKTGHEINELILGISLDEEKILDVQKNIIKNELHYFIGYNKDTIFYYDVVIQDKSKRVYFDLSDKNNVQEPQKKVFIITEEENKIEIKEAQ